MAVVQWATIHTKIHYRATINIYVYGSEQKIPDIRACSVYENHLGSFSFVFAIKSIQCNFNKIEDFETRRFGI